jgi:imidazolonepropionase-like amidohydrolase
VKATIILLGAIVGVATASAAPAPAPTVVILAGTLGDGRSTASRRDVMITVRDKVIVAVAPVDTVPPDAEVINLRDSTVLPGLIDCHTHVTVVPGEAANPARWSFVDEAVLAPSIARATLEAGFTTIRDVGARSFVDISLRNAINRGDIPGPRIFAATMPLSPTGGHGDIEGYPPFVSFSEFSGIADGVDEIRKKIRFEVKYGADLIKILATAGAVSEEESTEATLYTDEELRAAVEEASVWGRKVAAHAHGAEGIKRAVRAGVASIEHGTFLDEEGARLMARSGTFLVKDSYEDRWTLEHAAEFGYSERVTQKLARVVAAHEAAFRLAVKHGVKIAFGSDGPDMPAGQNAKQFRDYIAWGMSPMDAIFTATRNAAELLGISDQVGAIRAGMHADIIAVRGEVLKDPTQLEHVTFVMKDGKIFKR